MDNRRKPYILVIESIRDSVTLKRRTLLLASPRIRETYVISYMYLIEPEDYLQVTSRPETLFRECAAFGNWLPHMDLRHKIYLRALAEMHPAKPDYILFYTGFTFYQFQCQLYYSLLKLMHHVPGVIVAGFSAGKTVKIPRADGPLESLAEYEKRAVFDITWHHKKTILFDPPVGLLDNSPLTRAVCDDLVQAVSEKRE